MNRRAAFYTLVSALSTASFVCAAPGWGTLSKRMLDLKVRQPAAVRLANTTIAFKGSSTNREYAPVEQSLLVTLETELISNEKTLVKKENAADADWVLDLRVTGYMAANPVTTTEGSGNSARTVTSWAGSINAAYQVLDRSGRVHDANNVSKAFNKDYGGGGSSSILNPFGRKPDKNEKVPHTTEDLKQILVREVVAEIASNLGNTSVEVPVRLAGGEEKLNRAAEFLDKHLWQRALEIVEPMPEFPKPEDESYRQYTLALIYEGMSYESLSSADQRANLYKAAEFYDKAVEDNPKDKYFVESVARVRTAIARYKQLDAAAAEDKAKLEGKAVKKVNVLRVVDIVDMVAAGVPEDLILGQINASPLDIDFTDKDTLIAIAKAKVPITVENALRKKAGAPLRKQ